MGVAFANDVGMTTCAPFIGVIRSSARHRWGSISLTGVEGRPSQRPASRVPHALLRPNVALDPDAATET